MSLTRSLLKEMQLADDQIEQIIQAHAETVSALKGEISSSNEERAMLMEQLAEATLHARDAQAVQEEFDRYKAEAEAAAAAGEIQRMIHEALIRAGANEKAVALLAREITPEAIELENGKPQNLEELIAPVQEKYAAFFAQPMPKPVPCIQPPSTLHGTLTRQDVDRMTPEEINRNWAAVRGVLARN